MDVDSEEVSDAIDVDLLLFMASYLLLQCSAAPSGKYYLEIKGTPVDAPFGKLYYCYIAIVNTIN